MTTCDDNGTERELPDLGSGDVPSSPPGDSDLVLDGDGPPTLTQWGDCDVHTAIVRGLAKYVSQLEPEHLGRALSFVSVQDGWADQYENAEAGYPAAAVWSTELGKYSGAPMGGSQPLAQFDDGGQLVTALFRRDEYELEALTLRVWCSDREMRIGVRRALEQHLAPHPDQAGFHLRLPHYHGVIAGYGLVAGAFDDNEGSALAGESTLTMILQARAPRVSLHCYPHTTLRSEGTILARGSVL